MLRAGRFTASTTNPWPTKTFLDSHDNLQICHERPNSPTLMSHGKREIKALPMSLPQQGISSTDMPGREGMKPICVHLIQDSLLAQSLAADLTLRF